MKLTNIAICTSLLLMLFACGGGGGGATTDTSSNAVAAETCDGVCISAEASKK